MEFKGLSDAWLEELKNKNDIVDVISRYVRLDRRGSRYWGCCPFHHEKTPSFSVSVDRNTYHCYGCHKGGNVISFVMEIENVGFIDAVKILADRAGLKMPALTSRDGMSKEEKEKLYSLMKDAGRYYFSELQRSPETQDYLKKRGISKATATKFGLGKSKDFDSLIPALEKKGYTRKQMLDVGLIAEKNGKFYDSLGGRMIVPIIDPLGRVVAFGGRLMEKSDFAKYKNTKETLLFVKNRTLFNLNNVKELTRTQKINNIIIVEGYMDVIALHQAGIKNVVASMGTALTVQQAKLLKSYVDDVYICYDGDSAGQESTLRGLKILKSNNLNVKVVSLPENMDPDEVVRDKGVEAFYDCLKKALPLYEYRLVKAMAGFDLNTPDGRSGYAKKALAIISDLGVVEQGAYIEYISEKTSIPRQSLEKGIFEVEEKETLPERKLQDSAYYEASRYILYCIYYGKEFAKADIDPDCFIDFKYKRIYEYLLKCKMEGLNADLTAMETLPSDDPELKSILEFNYEKVSNPETYYRECLKRIRHEWYKENMRSLQEDYSKATSDDERAQILKLMSDLQKHKNAF